MGSAPPLCWLRVCGSLVPVLCVHLWGWGYDKLIILNIDYSATSYRYQMAQEMRDDVMEQIQVGLLTIFHLNLLDYCLPDAFI